MLSAEKADRRHRFPPTLWSQVISAQAGNPHDLEEICRRYWFPLYLFARRNGHSREAAEDLTQGFLAKFLEKDWLAKAERCRGRLRSFMLIHFKGYMRDEWRRGAAAKRGGRAAHLPCDFDDADARCDNEPVDDASPDRLFDRAWASSLLERVLTRLREEFEANGQGTRFDILQQCLAWNSDAEQYTELAPLLGVSVSGFKAAVFRLRKRYGMLLREEVGDTLEDERDTEAEIDLSLIHI